MVVVTFCGHSTIYKTEDFSQWLAAILPSVIEGGASTFYLCGYGAAADSGLSPH